MKQMPVNKKGSPIRHVVTHAPGNSAPNVTFSARASMEVRNGKIMFRWRIFPVQERKPRAKA